MSTRCHIELYDQERLGVRLYHHSDGYPEFMLGKLTRFLDAAYEYLKEAGYPYWWDSERVAAVLVALSIEDYEQPLKPFSTGRANNHSDRANDDVGPYRTYGGVPVFQPCLEEHGDIEYVWRVTLLDEGQYRIECGTAAGVDVPLDDHAPIQ